MAEVVRRGDQNAVISKFCEVAPKAFHQGTASCRSQTRELLRQEYPVEVVLVSHSELLQLEVTLRHEEGQASKNPHLLWVHREYLSLLCFDGDVAQAKIDKFWLGKVCFDFAALILQNVLHLKRLALLSAEVDQERIDKLNEAKRLYEPKVIIFELHDLIVGAFLRDEVPQLRLTDLTVSKNGLESGGWVALWQDTMLAPQHGHDLVITSLRRCHFEESVRALEDGSLLRLLVGSCGQRDCHQHV